LQLVLHYFEFERIGGAILQERLEGKSREETDAKTQEEILSLIAQHVKVSTSPTFLYIDNYFFFKHIGTVLVTKQYIRSVLWIRTVTIFTQDLNTASESSESVPLGTN
jgi:hypothetical protein